MLQFNERRFNLRKAGGRGGRGEGRGVEGVVCLDNYFFFSTRFCSTFSFRRRRFFQLKKLSTYIGQSSKGVNLNTFAFAFPM